MTLQKQISLFTEDELTSLQGDSPANLTAKQGNAWEKKTNAIYGPECLEQFEKFNRHGSWARTFSALLIGMEGWFSTRCRLTWKLRGTKSRRMYFQLAPSTLPTDETEFGLLPTPRVSGQETYETRAARKGHEAAMSYLESAVDFMATRGLLPTPTVMDTNTGDLEKIDARRERAKSKGINGNGFGASIGELANRGLLPTPAAQDCNNSTLPPSQIERDTLPGALLRTGETSRLSPRFVMEMMGFPPDWTLLPFLAGHENQSKPEATQ